MSKPKLTQTDYTTLGSFYQLHLPLHIEFQIPKDDPVRLLRYFVEGMDLSKLYRTYSHIEKNQVSPRQLLEILIYAHMNGIRSSRKIEQSCKRDINFMYLLEDKHAPDHATIARFRSIHLAACAKEIFAQMDIRLVGLGEISLDNIFIDGTKIEACANKYKFVWKKAVTKNMQKLMDKIPAFMEQAEETFGVHVIYGKEIQMYHLKRLRRKLKRLQRQEGILFVHGIGKRKTPLQKTLETLDEYIHRLKDYVYKLHVCGTRNSFAKTEHDATFMRMKEDAMKNGQLKPAYNIQYGIDAEYVVWVTEGPQPTDMTMLIPFLQDFEEHFPNRYPNVIADAGYESEENYLYLEKQGQTAYIKPNNYELSKQRKYRKDIGRRENMPYCTEEDFYVCANGRKISVTGGRKQKTRTGYETWKTQYACENCDGCALKAQCIHGNHSKIPLEERTKHFEVSKTFQQKRAEDMERITSIKGIELRVNRSIQSEGTFANVKEDLQFRRFLGRGKVNALVESMLLAMAHNICKMHHKIQSGRSGQYLFPINKAA
ncbi:MAG: IS1182 family transposase [Veillonellales bacterium]